MYIWSRANVFKYIKIVNTLFYKNTRTNAVRCLNNTPLQNKLEKESKSENTKWTRIYYFPYIRHAAVLNRLKIYQTGLTMAAIPVTSLMYTYDLVEASFIPITTGCALLASITLYVATGFFRKLIGIVCIAEDDKFVKISHPTFWGSRKDITVPLEDIVPLSDCDCNPNDTYVKLQRYSSNDILYLTLKYGDILDLTKFELVFGNLEVIGLKKK